MNISLKDIEAGLSFTEWDFGNNVLYNLCQENIKHDDEKKIIAKVWLIGRSYAAAIERRRNKMDINDNFYINTVAPAFLRSELDKQINSIKDENAIDEKNIPRILHVHYYLMQLIKNITDMEKRSFCSKYLHFHLPNLFYLYDSRAVQTIRSFQNRVPKEFRYITQRENIDPEYAKFFIKSYVVTIFIESEYKMKLTPREFDKILIAKANNENA